MLKGRPLQDAEDAITLQQLQKQNKQLKEDLAKEKRLAEEAVNALDQFRNTKRAPKIPVNSARKRLKGDVVEVIFGDLHGNKQNKEAVSALLRDLKGIQPDRIFMGGDIIDCGGFLAEHHTLGYVSESEDSYVEDCEATNQFLDALQEICPSAEIDYLEGNHEWRVERWAMNQKLAHHKDVDLLRRTFHPRNTLHLEKRGITYYEQGKVHVPNAPVGWVRKDNLWYVHKLSNASDSAQKALDLSASNVVYFDTHRAQYKPSYLPAHGMISAWNPGCLCNRQPLYCNTRPTRWTHGYLIRFISAGGAFQMVPISIDDGVSFGGVMFSRNTNTTNNTGDE